MLEFNTSHPWLAPLAGYSDLAMRLLCNKYGAKVCVTEMVSAKGIVYGGKNTQYLLKTSADDKNVIVQLFGNEPQFLAEAIARIQEQGFEYFDINMGCSVPKVVKTGAGAAMLKDVDNLLHCAEAVIKQSNKKVGFKFRLGYEMHNTMYKEFVPALCDMGALYLALHPRFARQLFTGKANWQALAELKELATVPVIASGDLLSAQDAIDCIKQTKVDSVMFARGALANPAVFSEYHALLNNEDVPTRTLDDAYAMIFYYSNLCKEHFPDRALVRMRTFVPRIIHYFHNVSHLRKAIIAANSWEEFYSVMHTFYTLQTGKEYVQ